ncbi:hypothetical protein HX837_04535 [Marine Group I thaumarchaeote]|jgi:hypothetical protein|uniref:Uncharacterized protein n=1 Tax=Marine Group I thaumarchaeote TaxID=2511932 RepID=A0A7K4MPF1_9ARCH|nr:DUF6356 family protein [Alphaproteobacteria bacterium]NWJ43460.1 hypothetical protein [Marine Group I thaumarchaeote]
MGYPKKDREVLKQDGMGYWKHLICQLCIIWTLFKMIIAMFIHGLLPRCFPTYFANELKKLHKRWIHDEWIKESKNEEG